MKCNIYDRGTEHQNVTRDILVRVNPVRLPVVREAGELAAAVVLVVHGAGHVLQVLQVRADHHVAQRYEVAVLQVLH